MAEGAEKDRTLDRIHEINFNMLSDIDRILSKYGCRYYLFFGGLLGALRHHDFIPWDNDVDIVMWRTDFEKALPHLYEELDPELYEIIMPGDYGKKYFDDVPRVNYKKATIKMDPVYVSYYEDKANRIPIDIYFVDRVPEDLRGKMLILRLELLYGLANAHRWKLEIQNYRGITKAAAVVLYGLGKLFPADYIRKKTDRISRKYDGDPSIHSCRITNDTIHTFSLPFNDKQFGETIPVPIRDRFFEGPTDPEECMTIRYGDYMQLPPEEERIPHWGFIPVTEDTFIFDD